MTGVAQIDSAEEFNSLVGVDRPEAPLVSLHIGTGNIVGSFPDGAGGSFTPQVVNSQLSGVAGVGVSVDDAQARRAALFVNDTGSVWGLSLTYSSGGGIPFVVDQAGTTLLRIDDTGRASFPVSLKVGGAGTAAASSALDVESTTKGLLVPRMTKAQRNAIATPANGLAIYQTDSTPGFRFYEGGAWVRPTVSADP